MLNGVTVGDSVFNANVLMLLSVVLVGLHDPNSRKADLIKRPMVSASPETVQPVNHHDVEIWNISVRHFIDISSDIPRRRVDFATLRSSLPRFRLCFDISRPL